MGSLFTLNSISVHTNKVSYYYSLKWRFNIKTVLILLGVLICSVLGRDITVSADIAHVRSEPSLSASVSGKLHFSASCSVIDSSGEWYQIHVDRKQKLYYESESELSGWIHKSLVADSPLSPSDSLKNASTLSDSILWIERLYVSGDYNDSTIPKLLIEGLNTLEDSGKSIYYHEEIANLDPIYLAHSHSGQVRVIGTFDRAGEFTSLEQPVYSENGYNGPYNEYMDDDPIPNMKQLRLHLLSKKWYSLFENWDTYKPFFYFNRSYLFPATDTVLNRQYHFYPGSVEDMVLQGVSFGETNRLEHHLNAFSTEVITPYSNKTPISKDELVIYYNFAETLAEIDSCHFSSMEYTRLPHGLVDIVVTLSDCNYCANGEIKRGIFNSEGTLLTQWHPRAESVYSGVDNAIRPWFQINGLDEYCFTIMPYLEYSCQSEKGGANCGMVLYRIGPDGVKIFTIREDICGC